MERALKYSNYFETSLTRDITKRRKESHHYESVPFPQFPMTFEKTEIPEFHTEINSVKLQDAHLLENGIVQPNQRKAYSIYTKVEEKYNPEKNEFEQMKRKPKESIDLLEKTGAIVKGSINKLRKPNKSKIGKRLKKNLATNKNAINCEKRA